MKTFLFIVALTAIAIPIAGCSDPVDECLRDPACRAAAAERLRSEGQENAARNLERGR